MRYLTYRLDLVQTWNTVQSCASNGLVLHDPCPLPAPVSCQAILLQLARYERYLDVIEADKLLRSVLGGLAWGFAWGLGVGIDLKGYNLSGLNTRFRFCP